jgi:hypothetical protein
VGRAVVRISVIATLAVLIGIFYSNVTRQARWVEVPVDSDWFIFLRQAQLFQQRGPIGGFDTGIRDDNTRYVIEKAKSLHLMVTPWGHDYKSKTDHLSLVSPPGTGLLLSFFSPGKQERSVFVACSAFILLFLAAFVITARSWMQSAAAGLLGVFSYAAMYRFVHDWSVVPSIAVTTLAGYAPSFCLLRQKIAPASLLLGIVIGMGADFRLGNLFLAFGVAAGLGVIFIQGARVAAILASASFVLGLAVGCAPMLLANAFNSGNPLVTTYGAPNTQAWHFDPHVFVGGLQFYVQNGTVLALIIIPAVALAALALARRQLNLAGAAPAGLRRGELALHHGLPRLLRHSASLLSGSRRGLRVVDGGFSVHPRG